MWAKIQNAQPSDITIVYFFNGLILFRAIVYFDIGILNKFLRLVLCYEVIRLFLGEAVEKYVLTFSKQLPPYLKLLNVLLKNMDY